MVKSFINPAEMNSQSQTVKISEQKLDSSKSELNIIENLIKLNDAKEILKDKTTCLVYFQFLSENSVLSSAFEILKDEDKSKLTEIFISILNNFYENIKDYLEQYDLQYLDSEKNFPFAIFLLLMNTIRNWSNKSVAFSMKFTEKKGIQTLFKYLNDEYIIFELTSTSKIHNLVNALYRAILGSIHNLSNLEYQYQLEWKEVDAFNSLIKIANLTGSTKSLSEMHFVCYLALANIFEDKDVSKLSDIRSIVESISKIVGVGAECLEKKEDIVAIKMNVHEHNNEILDVAFINIEESGGMWSIIELLKGLYRLSVNDKIKYDMYETYSLKHHLRKIIYSSDEIELEFAIKLLWQLCFNNLVAKDVKEDKKLLKFIEKICKNNKKNKNLLHYCEGMIWQLKQYEISLKEQNEKSRKNLENSLEKNKHIMISYNRESRDLCIKIKNELEKNGLKIWIDIEDIHGSSLESMANAVEDSCCVLICMTEKYKQSPNCRAEGEYAFQLKKPIVPLIMQSNYKPDGWLGIILGSRIFIDFTKYDFVECVRRLNKEVLNFKKEISQKNEKEDATDQAHFKVIENKSITSSAQNNETKSEINWTEQDVNNWIEAKKFNFLIIDNIRPCDGRLLYQMFTMVRDVPEFFYSSLNVKGQITLRDSAYFASELKKLFE